VTQLLELWALRWRLRGNRDSYWRRPRCPRCGRAYGSRIVDNEHDVPVRCDWDGAWWTIPKGH